MQRPAIIAVCVILVSCFCCTSCTEKSAQKFVQSFEEDKIVEELLQYDINNDGQLSEEEISLGQPQIQKWLDRYSDLQNTVNKDIDEEHVDDTVDTDTVHAAVNEQDEDDDGVEIEVEDDMEVIQDEVTEADGTRDAILICLASAGVGFATFLAFYYVCKKGQADRHKKLQEKEELLAQRREAWLTKVQGPPDTQTTQSSSTSQAAKPSKHGQTLSASSTLESAPQMPASPKGGGSTPRVENGHGDEFHKLSSKNAAVSQASGDASSYHEPSSRHATQANTGRPEVRMSADISDKHSFSNDSNNTKAANDCVSSDAVSRTSEVVPSISIDTVDSEHESHRIFTSQERPSNSHTIVPQEKSADREKTVKFLEDVLSCTMTLQDREGVKTRYSLGKFTVAASKFPSTVEEVEVMIEVLVHQVFIKQISKVKFSLSAYNACECFCAGYNDKMVDATSLVVKREAIKAIASHFMEEAKSGGTTLTTDDDLWSMYGGGSGSESYETYTFIPRLVNRAEDGIAVSQQLMSELLALEHGKCILDALMKTAGFRIKSVDRLDEIILSQGACLEALEVLVANSQFGETFGRVLAMELEQAAEHSLGNYFEQKSSLSHLLSLSTIPVSAGKRHDFAPRDAAVLPFKSARSFPRLTHDDVRTLETMIQGGLHKIQQIVFSALKRVVSNKSTRETGLAWLAAVLSLNELRTTSLSDETEGMPGACSDGFMLNLCSLLLELFLPISSDHQKLLKVDLGYSASPACRLNYDFEACLAGGQIVSEKGHERRIGVLATELQGQQSFITECFHLTQRALSVGVIPAIKHYSKMHRFYSSQMQMVAGTDREEAVKHMHILITVVWETCLLDTELARNITIFYISQATLILAAVKQEAEKGNKEEAEKSQRKLLSAVPEFCVKDMAQWFTFLATSVLRAHPHAVKGLTLTPFVDCCVMLLERPDLMPGPIPASKIVSALLSFMKSEDDDNTSPHRQGWGSGVMSDLAAMVHTCPSAQTNLGPALLRTFISVDVVEGLDVDKDTFDKYSSRVEISQLVKKLWSRMDCRASILHQCGSDLFQSFLDSILDTLLYVLHDSLSRLANVKKTETLKANEAEWESLSKMEQAEKDRFYRSEESVAAGFMRQAKKTLQFLDLLSQSEEVARCFTHQPLAARAASTINGFLESLCGAKAKDFKVKNMAKYDFNPGELLLTIVNIILRITLQDHSRHDGYLVSMVRDPDFETANLEKAQSVISSKGLAGEDTVDQIAQLLEQLKKLASEEKVTSTADVSSMSDSNWMEAMLELEFDREQLRVDYIAMMQDKRFYTAHIQDSHSFQGNMQGLDPRSAKVKTLMKEMKQLQQNLPVHPEASIFVRQDEDRMDVMRALVTGPAGTPYSLGCFCFDIYFPTSYPNSPPLVKIITTGNGTVRFNPNLYADGKVCLSLLGTWHAGDASEKWNPSKSSLYQVLVSIQSMILTPDPVFNEPGYERQQGTEEGEVQSRQYNWKLHLQTLRHAILGQLRNPPPGFEKLIRFHFALQREAVLKQCAEWVRGCKDQDLLKRLRQAADAIFEELMQLEVNFNEKDENDEEEEEEEV